MQNRTSDSTLSVRIFRAKLQKTGLQFFVQSRKVIFSQTRPAHMHRTQLQISCWRHSRVSVRSRLVCRHYFQKLLLRLYLNLEKHTVLERLILEQTAFVPQRKRTFLNFANKTGVLGIFAHLLPTTALLFEQS